jgi:cell division protein FtsQ
LLKLKVKRFLLTFLSIAVISGLAYILGWSSLLTVKSVEITGTTSSTVITNDLATKGLSIQPGMKLARVDIRAINSTLAAQDWLATYSVKRSWFSRNIIIKVDEKIAVAKAQDNMQEIIYFDNEGRLFKPVSFNQINLGDSLPMVTSESNSAADLAEVAQLLKQMPISLTQLVDHLVGISIGKSGYIVMSTQIDGRAVRINWGKAESVEQKSKVFTALSKLPENKGAKYFDLAIPDSPIVS